MINSVKELVFSGIGREVQFSQRATARLRSGPEHVSELGRQQCLANLRSSWKIFASTMKGRINLPADDISLVTTHCGNKLPNDTQTYLYEPHLSKLTMHDIKLKIKCV